MHHIKKALVGAIAATVLVAVFAAVPARAQIDNSALIVQLKAQIAALMVQLQALQAQQGSTLWCYTFNTNMGVGSQNDDVTNLIRALTRERLMAGEIDLQTQKAGAVFDEGVAGTVVQFQQRYGIPTTGFVGPLTRGRLNRLYGCGSVPANPSAGSLRIIYPSEGDSWVIGQNHQITLSGGAPYDGHCDNVFSLLDTNGKLVGYIGGGLGPNKMQTSQIWDTKTLYDLTCGTSANTFAVQPGKYRIRFQDTDPVNAPSASNAPITVYSGYFNIVSGGVVAPAMTPEIFSIVITTSQVKDGWLTFSAGSQVTVTGRNLAKVDLYDTPTGTEAQSQIIASMEKFSTDANGVQTWTYRLGSLDVLATSFLAVGTGTNGLQVKSQDLGNVYEEPARG
jgi:hypothetical protein